jgi:hypothetical protein
MLIFNELQNTSLAACGASCAPKRFGEILDMRKHVPPEGRASARPAARFASLGMTRLAQLLD